jgi:hypothetical protein
VIALRRQSARTVAEPEDPLAARDRATVSVVPSASALERLERVAVPQCQSHCDTEIQPPSGPAWKAQGGATAPTMREATVAAVVRDSAYRPSDVVTRNRNRARRYPAPR